MIHQKAKSSYEDAIHRWPTKSKINETLSKLWSESNSLEALSTTSNFLNSETTQKVGTIHRTMLGEMLVLWSNKSDQMLHRPLYEANSFELFKQNARVHFLVNLGKMKKF